MSVHDRNAARYRLEGSLKFWCERWQLGGAGVVNACQATQSACEAGRSFVDLPGCTQHPWR